MDPLFTIFIYIIDGVIFGFLGSYISKQKGRPAKEGFSLGFFLGIIGVLIATLLPTINNIDISKKISLAASSTGNSKNYKTCLKCHHANPRGVNACEECGTVFDNTNQNWADFKFKWIICPNCGLENKTSNYYCQSCGEGLISKPASSATNSKNFKTCLKCHHSNPRDAKVCEECGTAFDNSTQK